jgi:hypothetical protein
VKVYLHSDCVNRTIRKYLGKKDGRVGGVGGGVVSDICFEKVKSIERFKMRKMVRLFRISSLFLFGNLALYSLVIPFITTMN